MLKSGTNLLARKTSLLKKPHLPGATLEIRRQFFAKPLYALAACRIRPACGIFIKLACHKSARDAPLPQFNLDPGWTDAAIEPPANIDFYKAFIA